MTRFSMIAAGLASTAVALGLTLAPAMAGASAAVRPAHHRVISDCYFLKRFTAKHWWDKRYHVLSYTKIACADRPQSINVQLQVQLRVKKPTVHYKTIRWGPVRVEKPPASGHTYRLAVHCGHGYYRGAVGIWGVSSTGDPFPERVWHFRSIRIANCKPGSGSINGPAVPGRIASVAATVNVMPHRSAEHQGCGFAPRAVVRAHRTRLALHVSDNTCWVKARGRCKYVQGSRVIRRTYLGRVTGARTGVSRMHCAGISGWSGKGLRWDGARWRVTTSSRWRNMRLGSGK